MMDYPRKDVEAIVKALLVRVPAEASELNVDGRTEGKAWTTAVKHVLHQLGTERGYESIYTQRELGVREFLLDFVWWDKKKGVGVLACESEFGNTRFESGNPLLVGEDFDKLLSFKAPLKLMIFDSYTNAKAPTPTRNDILTEVHRYVTEYGYHIAGEVYVLIDFCTDPKIWICTVKSEGPGSTLKFEEMLIDLPLD